MAYVDLREFIARLEQEKEIIRVKTEVDIKYEMGAVCRHVLNAGGVEKNKALFFEKPKGYSIPVAAGLLDSWRSPIPLLTSLSIVSTSSVKAFSFYSSPGHTIW
jgi:UbiD family decarboxylase